MGGLAPGEAGPSGAASRRDRARPGGVPIDGVFPGGVASEGAAARGILFLRGGAEGTDV